MPDRERREKLTFYLAVEILKVFFATGTIAYATYIVELDMMSPH